MNELECTLDYESTRDVVERLRPATRESDRTLVWVDATRILALARDVRGQIEIFVVCEPILATDPLIGENLEHQQWTTSTGEPLSANRLVLPAASYFDSVAAFLCAELIENGVTDDHLGGFNRSEPVIALALRRAALSNQALVGLAGELLVLARLVESMPYYATQIINSWYGSSPSTRDLQLGPIGVEIKTTSGFSSVHHIQGLHQIELGIGVDDTPETRLLLLSVGIEWLPANSRTGQSIPDLVDSVLATVGDPSLRDAFLDRVKQYGGDASMGYDHRRQRTLLRYARRFQSRFERLYDLADDRLHLLRSDDVERADHVEAGSISFRVHLPGKVRGDINPVSGMTAVTARISKLIQEESTSDER